MGLRIECQLISNTFDWLQQNDSFTDTYKRPVIEGKRTIVSALVAYSKEEEDAGL